MTKVTNDTIFDLQCADDAALPSNKPDGLQRQLDAISSAYSRAGLVVNSKKTEVLYLPSDSSLPPTFHISGDQRGLTEQFTYLGSIITSTCDLTAEIQHRVNPASTSFGRLSKRVFTNRDLSTRTKMAVCNAICVSALLYACAQPTTSNDNTVGIRLYSTRPCLRLSLWNESPHAPTQGNALSSVIVELREREQLLLSSVWERAIPLYHTFQSEIDFSNETTVTFVLFRIGGLKLNDILLIFITQGVL